MKLLARSVDSSSGHLMEFINVGVLSFVSHYCYPSDSTAPPPENALCTLQGS